MNLLILAVLAIVIHKVRLRVAFPWIPLVLVCGGLLAKLLPFEGQHLPHLRRLLTILSLAWVFLQGGRVLAAYPIGEQRKDLQHLVAVGPKLGWIVATLLAQLVMGWGAQDSLLLGALVMIGAPYVVSQFAPLARMLPILMWESYLLACFGTAWSVLILTCIQKHIDHPSLLMTAQETVLTAGAGLLVGAAASLVTRRWASRPILILMGASAYLLAATLRFGSGILAVAVLGYLSTRPGAKTVAVEPVDEEIQGVFVALLGLLVGASLPWSQLAVDAPRQILFALLLTLGVRAALVAVACRASQLTSEERRTLTLCHPSGVLTLAVGVELAVLSPPRLLTCLLWIVVVSNLTAWIAWIRRPR